MASEARGGGPRPPWVRLHPVSLLFHLASAGWRLIVPGILVLLFSRGDPGEFLLMVFFLPAAAIAVLRYLTYQYRLGPEELGIRDGILVRSERSIPYARIQNIDLVQNPFHRLLGVADVRVETAGSREAEAQIRVLSLAAVDRMRARVFQGREEALSRGTPAQGPAAAVPGPLPSPPREILRLPSTEIALFGLLAGRGLVLLLAGIAVLLQYGWLPLPSRGDPEVLRRLFERFALVPGPAALALLLGGLAGLWILLKGVSAAWGYVRFHGFTVSVQGEDLRTRYGLLTRVAATIPRGRIQWIEIRESPLQRLLGRVSVRVETAGGVAEDASPISHHWLAPVLPASEVPRLLSEAQPGLDLADLEWKPAAPRARRRIFFRWIVLSLVALGALAVATGPRALALLPAAALLAWLESGLRARSLRWTVAAQAVGVRRGWWRRTTMLTRPGKVQAVSLRETPFDRRHGMASVTADTAGGRLGGGAIRIPWLAREEAEGIHSVIARLAGESEHRW